MQCGFVPEAAALIAPTETVDRNTLLRDALRWLDARTSCIACNQCVQVSICERGSPRRRQAVRQDPWRNFRTMKNVSKGGEVQIRAGCAFELTAASNFVSHPAVALCNCPRATSFGLSALKQTSEQLHKQFELHLKPLTTSDLDPAQSTAPSAALAIGFQLLSPLDTDPCTSRLVVQRIARQDDLPRRPDRGLPQGPAFCL